MSGDPTFLPMIGARSAGAPPIFDRIAIVGLGLIGGSIALASREQWPRALVIGIDNKEVLERAMVLHAIDVGGDDLVMLSEAQLVVLAAPVEANIGVMAQLGDAISGNAIVTDVGSTKRQIIAAARLLPPRLTFVGGHPLAGAARGGVDFARSDLFRGRPWLFTPSPDSPPDALDKLFAFARALGSRPETLDSDEHDRLLAFLSHLPQIAASALMAVVGDHAREQGLALSGRGLADTTRLASSPVSVWADICRTNSDNIAMALDALIAALSDVRADLTSGHALRRLFDAANAWKARMPGK